MPHRVKFTVCLASALFLSTAVHAAPRAEDRALCQSHATEDRAACLREAGAARQAARRGELDEGAGSYEKNKLARCSYLPDADRQLCERRMRGDAHPRAAWCRG